MEKKRYITPFLGIIYMSLLQKGCALFESGASCIIFMLC